MEVDSKKRGYAGLVSTSVEKQDELGRHINNLKEILYDLQNHDTA